MRKLFSAITLPLTLALPVHALVDADVKETRPEQVNQRALQIIFSGEEALHYSISWSGGVKIGDLYLSIKKAGAPDSFLIHAKVTDYGLFKLFYPVDDTFITTVQGPLKLPVLYEVVQREGWNDAETHRIYRYDQKELQVTYRKNDQPVEMFTPDGTVYNEFSSFFITRALEFSGNPTVIVPTFADKKRHEVEVKVLGRERRGSLFGPVDTIQVMPKMSFKGLYDKEGDTVFWITDDQCRVPIEIQSKIVVGSLKADLVEYWNPACGKFSGGKMESPGFVETEK